MLSSLKMPKFLEKPRFWLFLVVLLVVFAIMYLVFIFNKKEGYTNYALAAGPEGQKDLREMGLDDADMAALQYVQDKDNPLTPLIENCESVRRWDCTQLDNPDFSANCGICSADGVDSKGKKYKGAVGLYVDPGIISTAVNEYKKSGTIPNIRPSVGSCDGQFLVVRPHCDTQQDRDYCSKVRKMTPEVVTRCGKCVDAETPTFVYMGKRGGESSGYGLIPGTGTFPYKHKVRLRILTNGNNECTLYIRDPINTGAINPQTNQPYENIYPAKNGSFYDFDLDNVVENQKFELVVKWPEYYDYDYSYEENNRISSLVTPIRAPLLNAYYGTLGDAENNGDDVIDVASNIKGKNRTCENVTIKVSNDLLGNMPDPAPNKPKQLRLIYGDGEQSVTAYGLLGNETTVSTAADGGKAYKKLCPVGITKAQAQEKVCTMDEFDKKINGRTYAGGSRTNMHRANLYWGSTGNVCVKDAPRPPRGITGIWESIGYAPRRIPLEKTVTTINGLLVSKAGPPSLGTMLKNAFNFNNKITESLFIPNHANWFWPEDDPDRGGVPQIAVFSIYVPATLRDTTKLSDTPICSSGPIITNMKNETSPCDSLPNGEKQKPGTYTGTCLKSVYLANGCNKEGKSYPNTDLKAMMLSGNGKFDLATIMKNVSDKFNMAKKGIAPDGKAISKEDRHFAVFDCFGKLPGDVCNPFNEDTPPMPMTAECLDFLWKNKGKKVPSVGSSTYAVGNVAPPTSQGSFAPLSTASAKIFGAGVALGAASIPPPLANDILIQSQTAAEALAKKADQYANANQPKAAQFSADAATTLWQTARQAAIVVGQQPPRPPQKEEEQ